MQKMGFVIAILLTVIVAGAASAEEVIYFTNGTVLPIRSHKVEGDQIKVDLGDNGFMAFPKSVVEKIENAPDVILMPSTANKMFASDPSTRVHGAAPRQAATTWALPDRNDKVDPSSTIQWKGGVPSKAPLANHENLSAREFRVNNVPELRGVGETGGKDQPPGSPQKISTSVAPKKTLRQFQRDD